MMKKKNLIVLLITLSFFLLNSVTIFSEDQTYLFTSDELEVQTKITSTVEIKPTSSSYEVEYLKADLYMFPMNDSRQSVISVQTSPSAELIDDKIRYTWNNPEQGKLNYGLVSTVKTQNKYQEVDKKINFPINENNVSNFQEYLNPTELIDADNLMIIRQASELAEGEDDLFLLENKLANYVKNNIQYNLTTVTAEVTQKASWVLSNKEGVCDELTTLFIAMNRALGVPARFVSGVAYTNSPLFTNPWGPHAWAEVYFPGEGWVPYDLTYGEFGYLDATHISMMKTADAQQSSTKFEWRARNIEVNTNKLDMQTNVIRATGTIESKVSLSTDVLDNQVGFGSYNVVHTNVKNLKNYYVPVTLYLSKTEGIETLTENPVHLVLKPNEEKDAYWVIKITSKLDKNYIYTFPIVAYTTFNETAKTQIKSEYRNTVYDYEEMKNYYDAKQEEIQKVYSKNMDISCKANVSYVYVGETNNVDCEIKNAGNTQLDDLKVCLEKECKIINLSIGQKQILNFELLISDINNKPTIIAENKDASKTSILEIEILDKPSIKITDITYPSQVNYDKDYIITFIIEQESKSKLNNLTLQLITDRPIRQWEKDIFEGQKIIKLDMHGKDLNQGTNKFQIKAKYYDEKGRYYEKTEEFSIQLEKLNFFQNINYWIRKIISPFIDG
jgi:transglutaminase-like putative cysteine protease